MANLPLILLTSIPLILVANIPLILVADLPPIQVADILLILVASIHLILVADIRLILAPDLPPIQVADRTPSRESTGPALPGSCTLPPPRWRSLRPRGGPAHGHLCSYESLRLLLERVAVDSKSLQETSRCIARV